MKLIADYHTHTVHSHGKGSVADNIEAALVRGLQTVGIADHSVGHALYGIKRRGLAQYIADIEDAKRHYDGRIEIRAGIELNITGLDGSLDMPEGIRFDTVIMGYHKAALPRDLRTAFAFLSPKHRAQQITQAYMSALQRNRIDIVAHPGYGVPVDYRKLAQACADYGTLFEINNKHTELTEEDLREAASTGVKFVLSSDAHDPAHVGLAPHALALVKRVDIPASRIVNISEE